MAVSVANILIILGGSKSFGTHISENHLGTLFALFFLLGHGTKWARKANISPKIKGHITSTPAGARILLLDPTRKQFRF